MSKFEGAKRERDGEGGRLGQVLCRRSWVLMLPASMRKRNSMESALMTLDSRDREESLDCHSRSDTSQSPVIGERKSMTFFALHPLSSRLFKGCRHVISLKLDTRLHGKKNPLPHHLLFVFVLFPIIILPPLAPCLPPGLSSVSCCWQKIILARHRPTFSKSVALVSLIAL